MRNGVFSLVLALCGCQGPLPLSWSERTAADDRFVQLDGRTDLRLCYRDYGRPGGPPLICLHGLGANKAEFRETISRLGERHRLILVDLLGHGASSAPPFWDYSPTQQARHVRELIAALDLRDVTLVGTSYGGATSIEAARQYASAGDARVRALVLVAPPLFAWQLGGELNMIYERVAKPESERPFLLNLLSTRAMTETLTLKPSFFDKRRITPDIVSDAAYPLRDYSKRLSLVRAGRALCEWMNNQEDQQHRYEALHVPILLLRGQRDGVMPAEGMMRVARALPNSAYAEIPDVGHAVDAEQPDCFSDVVLQVVR